MKLGFDFAQPDNLLFKTVLLVIEKRTKKVRNNFNSLTLISIYKTKVMKIRMIWGNLVSHDLQKTIQFYTDLGFKQNGKETDELVSFIFAENHFIINFFIAERFETALKGKLANTKNENETIFSLSADSREEVDQWYKKVKEIGGTIFSEPENFQQGYTFGFADPDGHKYNFLYWPGM